MSEEYIKKLEETNRALEIENARLASENDKLRGELKEVENRGINQQSTLGGYGVSARGLGPGVSGVKNGKVYG